MKVFQKLCAGLLAGMMLISSAAAVDAAVLESKVYGPATEGENVGKYTVEFTNDALIPGNQYALLIAKWDNTTKPVAQATLPDINVNTLTYIDQAPADENKTVTFTDFIPKSVPNSVVLLGGEFEGGVESPIIIGYIDAQGVLVTGNVVTGSLVWGATVKMFDASMNEVASASADENGDYQLESIPTGEGYSVVVSRPGYCTYTINNIHVGEELKLPNISIEYLAGDIYNGGDGIVNVYDLNTMISEFNHVDNEIGVEVADLIPDSIINIYDLNTLISSFSNESVVVNYSDIK